MFDSLKIHSHFSSKEKAVVFRGDCMDLFREIPDESIQLVVTSPPYNIGMPVSCYLENLVLMRCQMISKERF